MGCLIADLTCLNRRRLKRADLGQELVNFPYTRKYKREIHKWNSVLTDSVHLKVLQVKLH